MKKNDQTSAGYPADAELTESGRPAPWRGKVPAILKAYAGEVGWDGVLKVVQEAMEVHGGLPEAIAARNRKEAKILGALAEMKAQRPGALERQFAGAFGDFVFATGPERSEPTATNQRTTDMSTKTQKSLAELEGEALEKLQWTILGMLADSGAANFARALGGAIGDIHVVRAPRDNGGGVAEINGYKRILGLIGDSGAADVASALEEAIRVHGSVKNASTAIGTYTDHIMQQAEGYAEDPTEEASIALSDAVWRGQPDRRY